MTPCLKQLIKANATILSRLYFILMNNRVRGRKGNHFYWKNVFFRGLRLVFYGSDNEISLGGKDPSVFTNCHIEVHGDHHRIIIKGGVGANDLRIYCADNNCKVMVEEGTQFSGITELAVMEGTKIFVGKDCLFSANISLRAGDSHSIIDAYSGVRVNPSKDIILGNHIWICNTVIVTKGTMIGDNCVVATGSVVAGKAFPDNSVIGGNPAKIIKKGINWRTRKV